MMYHGILTPAHRQNPRSFSANTWKSEARRIGVAGNTPLGPSKPSLDPWPPATVRNAVFPSRAALSPVSASDSRRS